MKNTMLLIVSVVAIAFGQLSENFRKIDFFGKNTFAAAAINPLDSSFFIGDGALYHYDKDGKYIDGIDDYGTPAIPVNKVTAIAINTDGNIFIGTTKGLVRWNYSENTVTAIYDFIPYRSSRTILDLVIKDGKLYVGGDSCLVIIENLTSKPGDLTTADYIVHPIGRVVDIDLYRDIVWMWTTSNNPAYRGICKLDGASLTMHNPIGFDLKKIESMDVDNNGNVFIGISSGDYDSCYIMGLNIDGTWSKYIIAPKNSARFIEIDKNNNLWFITENYLGKLDLNNLATPMILENKSNNPSLHKNVIERMFLCFGEVSIMAYDAILINNPDSPIITSFAKTGYKAPITFGENHFNVSEPGNIKIKICSVKGQTLYSQNKYFSTGSHKLSFLSFIPSGSYFISLQTKSGLINQKMTIVK